jgi:hypothetical protein
MFRPSLVISDENGESKEEVIMKVRKGFLAVALGFGVVAAAIGVQSAEARPVVIVRPGFGFYGPAWYGPSWYGPAYGPAYVVPHRVTGDVKINTHEKQDMVYVDGGFAGQTGNLKKFSLRPGNHDIEIRNAFGQTIFHQTVNVISDRATEIKL